MNENPQQILFGFTIELFRRPLDGLHCVLGVAVRHFSHFKDAFHGGQHPRPLYCVAPDVRRTSLEEWSRDFLPLQHKKKDGAAVARGTNCTVSKAIFHKSEPTGL